MGQLDPSTKIHFTYERDALTQGEASRSIWVEFGKMLKGTEQLCNPNIPGYHTASQETHTHHPR